MMRTMRTLLLGGLALGVVAAAGTAEARTERLRWTHEDPSSVERYTIYTGSTSGGLSPSQDVVSPPSENGAFYTDITVADDASVWVAVSATGVGGESPLSNARLREPASGGGGGGGGGGGTPTPQSGILRFVLVTSGGCSKCSRCAAHKSERSPYCRAWRKDPSVVRRRARTTLEPMLRRAGAIGGRTSRSRRGCSVASRF